MNNLRTKIDINTHTYVWSVVFLQLHFLINTQIQCLFHRLSHSRFFFSRFPGTISSNLVCFVLRNMHDNDSFCVLFSSFFFSLASRSVISLPHFFSLLLLLNCITPSPSGWRQLHVIGPWTAPGSSDSNHPGFCIDAIAYTKKHRTEQKEKENI